MGLIGKERKDLIINQVDMFDVLNKLGFAMQERQRSMWNKFIKGDTVLVVKTDSNNKTLYFNSNGDNKDRGDVLDLVMNHSGQRMSFHQALKFLEDFSGTAIVSQPTVLRENKNVVERFNPNDYKIKPLPGSGHEFLRNRGLSGVYDSFHFNNTLHVAAHHPVEPGRKMLFGGRENIAFVLHPLGSEEIKAIEFRYNRVKIQGPGAGKSQAFWTSNKPVDSNDVFLLESPIDAMSHYKMFVEHRGNAPALQYISSAGTLTQNQIDQIKAYAKGRVFIGFDGDYSGFKYSAKIIEAFSDGKIKVEVTENEFQIDATYLNLGKASIKKADTDIRENFTSIVSAILSSNIVPSLILAMPAGKDFNEDLTSGIPCVYSFDQTIGSVDNFGKLIIEEQVKKKKKQILL